MNTKTNEGFESHGLKSIFYGALIFVLILGLSGGAIAASISTDKADYSPGETVLISGSGFAANTQLTQINISRPDGALEVCPLAGRCDTLPATDAGGSFSNYAYTLNGIEGIYTVTASDGTNTAQTTFNDSRDIRSVTLNGQSNVIVAAGATVAVSITVRTTVIGGNDDWRSTAYLIEGQGWQCVDFAPDHTSAGTYTETFNINAPAVPGLYDVSFRAYANNGCSGSSDEKTLTDGLWVVSCGTPAILLNDGFESEDWDSNWDNNGVSNWDRSLLIEHSGGHSAHSSNYDVVDFTSDNLDASSASAIYVSFWYMLANTENNDFYLYYYDGSNYDFIADLGGGTENKWLHYTATIPDPQYFKSNFRISFWTGVGFLSEHVWVDDVLISNALCPSDEDACTVDACSGEGGCVYIQKTQCQNSDGCCPEGCHSSNDNDCEQNVGVGDNVAGSGLNLIDPPLGEDVCLGRATVITANLTINATDPNDPALGNVSLCINVTCTGGYTMNDKQYLNLSGTLSSVFQFTVNPPAVGTCDVTTCIDCDGTIPETNEDDNCESISFDVIDCRKRVPVSPAAILAVLGIITVIAVARIRK